MNWFVIYPQKNKEIIKQEFDKLQLKDFEVGVIIIDAADEYVEFVNKNLKYTGHINTSSVENLLDTIESMGGVDDDDLYVLKNGKITHKKVKF
ncbi:hypothetical protein KY319_00825 [Candidatus Woesearchaeota archaeon]|nr:hypothetical protein [Candidatus Woesearchaeota archaeon]